MVRPCRSPSFSSSAGRPSGPTAFAFAVTFIAVAISSSVGSIPRALTTGCCGSLFEMSGSSMTDLQFSSERKNLSHLSRIRYLSRSSLPSSSRTHCMCSHPILCTAVYKSTGCQPARGQLDRENGNFPVPGRA